MTDESSFIAVPIKDGDFISIPTVAGCWVWDGGHKTYDMHMHPRWLTRVVAKWLLELEWRGYD